MSDTPRTDAELERYADNRIHCDFARQLERELAAMTAERDHLRERLSFEEFRTDTFKELSGVEVKNMGEVVDKYKAMTAAKNKALEALKEEHEMRRDGDEYHYRLLCQCCKLIAELEKVI